MSPKKHYETPLLEVVDLKIEGSILDGSVEALTPVSGIFDTED